MPDKKRKILVTNALPYANGPIHIGHLVGYIQADIWVRFQRMLGHTVHYVCADDTHGTPIMLRAGQDGITPETLIERMHGEHVRDFKDFRVDFDNYDSTNSPETRELCEDIYAKLKANDLVAVHSVEQFYDPVKQMFLPDRYIKGECPKCGAKDQYGDSCEVCGSTYSPTDLKNPYSVVSGKKPVRKSSEHYFFRLSDRRCVEFLKQWTRSGTLQPEAANKMNEWFAAGLRDWDISRDAPYFGFPIPGTDGKKFFYVWLDAPVGYMASFKNLCKKKKLDFDAYWRKNPETELYHFIGKDILYFHALFWPAMLEYSGYRTPSKLAVNGFLTVNGEKMSKSRGTFITAESYLAHGLNPEWLRYYYAAKSNGTMEDIDLSFDDFVARQRFAGGILAGGVTDHAGEVADEEYGLVPQILELPKLVEEHRMAEMQVRRRGIETGLDPQRTIQGQFLAQIRFQKDFLRTALDQIDCLFRLIRHACSVSGLNSLGEGGIPPLAEAARYAGAVSR